MSLVEVTAGAWAYRAIPLETALIVSTTGVSRFAFRVSRFAFRACGLCTLGEGTPRSLQHLIFRFVLTAAIDSNPVAQTRFRTKKKTRRLFGPRVFHMAKFGRGDRIRTCDPLLPKQLR
jgi:hypothetical protein